MHILSDKVFLKKTLVNKLKKERCPLMNKIAIIKSRKQNLEIFKE